MDEARGKETPKPDAANANGATQNPTTNAAPNDLDKKQQAKINKGDDDNVAHGPV